MFADPTYAMGIRQAIAFFEANTPLTFVENGAGPNLIHFYYGGGCSSSVGRLYDTPVQYISIGYLCQYVGSLYIVMTIAGEYFCLIYEFPANIFVYY